MAQYRAKKDKNYNGIYLNTVLFQINSYDLEW